MTNKKLNEKFGLPDDGSSLDRRIVMKPVDNPEADHNYVRSNLFNNIELGQEALQDMVEFARSAQNARSYEVLNAMLKTLSEINKDYLKLHQDRKDLTETSDGPQVVHNNLNITTAQLLEMIDDRSKKD